MTRARDPVVLDAWYPVADATGAPGREVLCLLGQELVLTRDACGVSLHETGPDGRPTGPPLPVKVAYGCLWTTLGQPLQDIPDIPEAAEPDRRAIACGWVTLRTSAPRMVENFLDMAHFPFVHPGILGAEPQTEVPGYDFEIRRDVDEVWATNCRFFNALWATTETETEDMNRTYRVARPFVVVLYRVSRSDPMRKDVLAVFIHPVAETLCRAQVVTWLVDRDSPETALRLFEQVIFLQDRIIVENQRPLLLPLDTRQEIPTRADASSVAYRRWLKEKGLTWGTTSGVRAA